jgi:SAM-dependent methyltransferase
VGTIASYGSPDRAILSPLPHRRDFPSLSAARYRPEPRDGSAFSRIETTLIGMRRQHRSSVRILDAGCGDGQWTLHVARRAAVLGFVAVEARGFDVNAGGIRRARLLAAEFHDLRIGLTFDIADLLTGLRAEEDRGADIVLCHFDTVDALPISVRDRVAAEFARISAVSLVVVGSPR